MTLVSMLHSAAGVKKQGCFARRCVHLKQRDQNGLATMRVNNNKRLKTELEAGSLGFHPDEPNELEDVRALASPPSPPPPAPFIVFHSCAVASPTARPTSHVITSLSPFPRNSRGAPLWEPS